MKWKKLGQLFAPAENYPWMYSHAANPFVEHLSANALRIYFTCRNEFHQSHIGFVDVNPNQNFEILNVSDKPVIGPGQAGLFDDSGTAMGCLLTINQSKYLYYLGWNLKVTVPWMNTIGLAIADDSSNFLKYGRVPIMDRSEEDPFTISYPSILFDNGIYRMWYGSNLKWGKDQSEMDHVIKYAESADGIHWKRTNQVVIGLEYENEYALSKPCVIKDPDCYRMWYSFRAQREISTYRIGYAESFDGLDWIRKDNQVGIDVSSGGWDSEMICYPHIFDFNQKRYMLYNGNGYGKSGFGLAIMEK